MLERHFPRNAFASSEQINGAARRQARSRER
jgi:hypothetical protein